MLSAAMIVVRFCSTCEDDVSFEQPECLDGHGGGCPEWVCVECGDAVVVGFDLPEPTPAPYADRHVA